MEQLDSVEMALWDSNKFAPISLVSEKFAGRSGVSDAQRLKVSRSTALVATNAAISLVDALCLSLTRMAAIGATNLWLQSNI
jgi:hypothetical protein